MSLSPTFTPSGTPGGQRLVELPSGRFAHACGALWLPESRTALVADAHLGYGWAQRRRGQLGPVVDGGARQKLDQLLDELQPERLVLVGDAVHAPNPAPQERAFIEQTLAALAARTAVTIVLGNHDRGFARDFPTAPAEVVHHWESNDLLAIHGDRAAANGTGRTLISGHLHPAYTVYDDAGASQRIRVFLIGTHGYVLPAFSPFAAGFNVRCGLPTPVQAILGKGEVQVVAATGLRAVRLGPLSVLLRN